MNTNRNKHPEQSAPLLPLSGSSRNSLDTIDDASSIATITDRSSIAPPPSYRASSPFIPPGSSLTPATSSQRTPVPSESEERQLTKGGIVNLYARNLDDEAVDRFVRRSEGTTVSTLLRLVYALGHTRLLELL